MEALDFVNIGFGNYIKGDKIVAMFPMKQMVSKALYREAKEKGLMITVARGREMKTLILIDDGRVFVSAFSPESIMEHIETKLGWLDGEEGVRLELDELNKKISLANKKARGIED